MGDFRTAAEALRRLSLRPTSEQQRNMRRDALVPVRDEAHAIASANGNRVTGKYLASFGFGDKDRVTSSVGPQRGKAHATLGHLLEFGTAPHWQPRRQRMHPGAQPFPHWRPAFEMTKGQVVARLGRSLVGVILR